jgi:hypothetical protein
MQKRDYFVIFLVLIVFLSLLVAGISSKDDSSPLPGQALSNLLLSTDALSQETTQYTTVMEDTVASVNAGDTGDVKDSPHGTIISPIPSWIDAADTSWWNSTDSSFTVSTPKQLAGIARLMRLGITKFSGKTVNIANDIDLAGSLWEPIGFTDIDPFQGILDGGGHTISNMKILSEETRNGLFGILGPTGIIKDVKLSSVDMTIYRVCCPHNRAAGGVAGYSYGTVLNCTVSGTISATPDLEDIGLYCGGIVGDNKGTVSGCKFDGDIIASIVGGIVGGNSGTVSDCHKQNGRVSTGGFTICEGSIIGHIYTITDSYDDVIVLNNTFDREATGQQWGIGQDVRLSPVFPSNNGTTPIN